MLAFPACAVDYAYIPNSVSGTLSVINTATGQLSATVTPVTLDSTLNNTIYTAALRPGGANEVWFGQFSSNNKLGVLDTSNNTLKNVITGTGGSVAIAFSSSGASAYVSDFAGQKMHVVNATTKTVTSSVATGCNTIASAVKSDNSLVYFLCASTGAVKSLNTSNNAVATLATTGAAGYGLAYDATGTGKIYTSNNSTNQVKVVDLSNNAVSSITVGASGNVRTVAVRKNGTKVYAGNNSTLYIIDASNNSSQTTLAMGTTITGMAVSANDAALYVVLSNGTVKVVSTTTDAVTATVTAPNGTNSAWVWGDFLGNVQAAAAPSAGPTVTSSSVSGATAANAPSLNFAVVFSEAVSGVDASDFTLTATGTAAGTVGTPTTVDNINWTVPVTGVSGDGTLRLDVKTTGTGIAATAAGNAALSGGLNGTAFTVDNTPPATDSFSTTITPSTSGLPFKVRLNEAGTGYWLIVPNGSAAPTAAQILAGTNYGAVTITAAGNLALAASTTASPTATGVLTPGASYDLYFAAKDTAGNVQGNGAIQSVTGIVFPSLTYSTLSFAEAANSNGTISATATLTLTGDTFTGTNGDDFVAASKVTVTHLAAGLTATVTRTGNTTATLAFTGTATNKSVDIGNLTLAFANTAFTGNNAGNVVGATTSTLAIDFNPAIAYSATTFAEAVANDGSITATATLTLGGDTFIGSGDLVGRAVPGAMVSHLPAGLTATLTLTDSTHATLAFTGNATAHQAANNVNTLTVTLLASGLTGGNVSNGTNLNKNDLAITFANNAGALAYAATTFAEAVANDGSITATATLTLTGDTFTGSNGDELVGLGKVMVSNVPAGLIVTVTRASSTTATLAFAGNAAAHAAADSIANLGLAFQNSAFTNGNAAGIGNATRNDLALTFADNSVAGVCGAANGVATAFVPAASLCSAGTAGTVTTGSSWNWSCAGSGSGGNVSCSAPNASTATGSGSGRAVVSGGAWAINSAQSSGFIPTTGHVKSPPSLPPGYTFPHGLFDFTLMNGAAGSTATVTINYPSALPAGTVYWKYGKTASDPTPHWYQFAGAAIAGNVITLTIADGGGGDDDLLANGVIADPGGPGVPAPQVTSVPTLSEWGVIMLSALMALCGAAWLRRREGMPAA